MFHVTKLKLAVSRIGENGTSAGNPANLETARFRYLSKPHASLSRGHPFGPPTHHPAVTPRRRKRFLRGSHKLAVEDRGSRGQPASRSIEWEIVLLGQPEGGARRWFQTPHMSQGVAIRVGGRREACQPSISARLSANLYWTVLFRTISVVFSARHAFQPMKSGLLPILWCRSVIFNLAYTTYWGVRTTSGRLRRLNLGGDCDGAVEQLQMANGLTVHLREPLERPSLADGVEVRGSNVAGLEFAACDANCVFHEDESPSTGRTVCRLQLSISDVVEEEALDFGELLNLCRLLAVWFRLERGGELSMDWRNRRWIGHLRQSSVKVGRASSGYG